jgi:hypothetical protein
MVCRKAAQAKKGGLHLIWQDVVVTPDEAIQLFNAIHSNLCTLQSPVAKAIDDAVYLNNGLRMIFSFKKDDRDETDMYFPVLEKNLEDEGGATQTMNISLDTMDVQDIVTWLRACSVVAFSPPHLLLKKVGNIHWNAHGCDKDTTDKKNDKEYSVKDNTSDCVYDEAWMHISQGTPFEGVILKSRVNTARAVSFQTDSRHCMNIGRDHRSNHVYIVVTPKSVEQRCYCRCPGSTCIDFRGLLAGAGNLLSTLLFEMPARKRILPQSDSTVQAQAGKKLCDIIRAQRGKNAINKCE